MTYSWPEIFMTMQARREADAQVIRDMIDVRDHYNGQVVVPVYDVDGEATMPSMAPRLVSEVIDFIAMRATMARPSINCPAMDPFKPEGKGSMEYAAIRRRVLYARWESSALGDILLRRAYRHYAGYGSCAFIVVPDHKMGRARVELRDPLTTYPELRSPDDVREPINCGFIYGRSKEFISATFPQARGMLKENWHYDTLWDLVEWVDADDIVIGLLGPRSWATWRDRQAFQGMELARFPNKAGMVPIAVPRRVTLDRIYGMVTNSLGTIDMLDRMTALDILAAEKSIFPDLVILGENGREPQLLSGRWKDGREGEPNRIKDGKAQLLNSSPGPLTQPIVDRMERNVRVSTGLVPQAGGESYGSLRTGRAIDTMGSFAVDPRVQEAQEVVARSLRVVNEAIFAIEKGHFGNRTTVAFSGWAGDEGHVTYKPNEHFETFENVVSYAFPGTDVSQLTVGLGQMLAAKLMSRRTAQIKHPFIDDAQQEERLITIESLQDAVLTATLEQATQGTLPLVDLVSIAKNYLEHDDIIAAVNAAQQAAQARQAQQAPPPDQGQVTAPEAQPGLSPPGMGAEQPQGPPPELGAQIQGPSPSQDNLRNVIKALRAGESLRSPV